MDDSNALIAKPFNKGDQVPSEGDYVCVPCGYRHHYKVGDTFGECLSCLSGTPNTEHEEFAEGLEMWEKVDEENKPVDDQSATK